MEWDQLLLISFHSLRIKIIKNKCRIINLATLYGNTAKNKETQVTLNHKMLVVP